MALPYKLEIGRRRRLTEVGGRGQALIAALAIVVIVGGVVIARLGPSPQVEAPPVSVSVMAPSQVLPAPPAGVRPSVAPSNLVTSEVGLVNPAPSKADPQLGAVLNNVASRYQGSLGVVVKNVRTGATASINAEGKARAASLYKLFVLYSTLQGINKGEIRKDETLTLSGKAADDDPNAEWNEGTRISLQDAMQAMIKVSNNASADMLEERVGGDDRINADMKSLGLKQTSIGKDFAFTSAGDMALLLEAIVSGKAINPQASREMLGLLSDQRRDDRLPLPLPLNVKVAHKTGELTHLRNEAGIVYSPSGPYIFVALSDGGKDDAAARQPIVDLSRDVYAYMEPWGLTQYLGLSPRLAGEVFQTFDSKGRIAPLDDPWSETTSVDAAGVKLAEGVRGVSLREMVIPSLAAMQRDAEAAGATFFVTSGYKPPRGVDAPFVQRDATALPIKVQLAPPKKPTPGPSPTPVPTPKVPPPPPAPPAASQQWLGTVVGVADSPGGKPTQPSYAGSATGRWLVEHSWEYGFVLTPAESSEGKALGYEPWKLRWVGRGMSEQLRSIGYERDPSTIVPAELQKAERELSDPSRWRDIEKPFLFDE